MRTLTRDRYLSDDELARLIRAARVRRHVNALRDYTLLCVLANLGVRPGEALATRVADVNELTGVRPWLRVRRLKKREALGIIDDLPLSKPLALVLYRYLRALRLAHDGELAPAVRLFPLTVRQAERAFHYYAKLADLKGRPTLYALRHTAATRAFEATGDLRLVQVMLGHSRITTTEVYAHVSPARRAALAERVGGVV